MSVQTDTLKTVIKINRKNLSFMGKDSFDLIQAYTVLKLMARHKRLEKSQTLSEPNDSFQS